ncbi:MAG: DUF5686 family protein [Syntrophothermus sp.]
MIRAGSKAAILLFFILVSNLFAQNFRIEGVVLDKTSRQPLSYATVQLKGTATGTTTNSQGRFILDLPRGESKLIVSFIGYKSFEAKINIPGSDKLEFRLEPISIELPAIMISSKDEDPAYRIIRNAIKNKSVNRKAVSAFEYDEYRKAIFKSAGKIASVEESFIKGYRSDAGQEELVLASFKSENIKKDNKNIASFQNLKTDFYQDTMDIIGNRIHMPLADDAIDFYKYKLLNTKPTEDKFIYYIEVIPRSELRPLFKGLLMIEDSSFALAGLDLKSNDGMVVPFITDLSLRFTENRIKLNYAWFPQYLESKISVGVNLSGLLAVEKMEMEQFRSFTNQKINLSGLDTASVKANNPFARLAYRDTAASDTIKTGLKKAEKSAIKPALLSRTETDSLRPIPLNDKEITAYSELDSTKKPLSMLKTSGVLSSYIPKDGEKKSGGLGFLGDAADALFTYINFRNNRSAGISLGARYEGSLDTSFTAAGSALYSFGIKKPEGYASLVYRTEKKNGWEFTVSGFSSMKRWNENTQFTELMNTFSVTFGLEDNFNYYMSKGFSAGVRKNWKEFGEAGLRFLSEKQTSVSEINHQRIFNSRFGNRTNPAVKEGMDSRLSLNITTGEDPLSFQFMPRSGIAFTADISAKELGSDFSYTKFYTAGQIKFNTFYRELLFPPSMVVRAEAGIINGHYGVQHLLSPENHLAFISPFGVFRGVRPYEYAGNKMAAIHAEHNWRGIIFQRIGLKYLSELNYGITTGASALKMWNTSDISYGRSGGPVYWEVYSGVTGIIGIIKVEAVYTSTRLFLVRGGFTLSL